MFFLYTLLMRIVAVLLPLVAFFSPKVRVFCQGRRHTLSILGGKLLPTDEVLWLHAASLGEYEQGLPIIKALVARYPHKKVVVSFFSPSGFEVKKHSPDAHAVVYLPLDTPELMSEFLDILHPQMAIFVKYEFWPCCLSLLRKRGVPTYLVSGIFRQEQLFFKPYGAFMRGVLGCFTHFFVQNEKSLRLLQSIGLEQVTLSGDTRFDRVLSIATQDNSLPFIEHFKADAPCMVLGSTWPDDEALFSPFIAQSQGVKFIIAPHHIAPQQLLTLRSAIGKKALLYSQMQGENLSNYDVLIIDTIGLLTKIYSYATVAYVGGGMRTGLHNVLEPAVFGIPVLIGLHYAKFQEATDMVALGAAHSVGTARGFAQQADVFLKNPSLASASGRLATDYIAQKAGATEAFMRAIASLQ